MKGKRSKGEATALIITFVISGMLTSVLGVRQVSRLTTEPVWVATADLVAGQTITQNYIREARIKKTNADTVDISGLLGKTLATNKSEGDYFSAGDLQRPARSWLGDSVPEGRVLYTLSPRTDSIPHEQLRSGDRFDVLVSNRNGVRTVARDVQLIGVMNNAGSKATTAQTGRSLLTSLASTNKQEEQNEVTDSPLVIAVRPGDVYPLASIRSGDDVSLVLHGQAEVSEGQLLRLRPRQQQVHQVEIVSGLERRRVNTY